MPIKNVMPMPIINLNYWPLPTNVFLNNWPLKIIHINCWEVKKWQWTMKNVNEFKNDDLKKEFQRWKLNAIILMKVFKLKNWNKMPAHQDGEVLTWVGPSHGTAIFCSDAPVERWEPGERIPDVTRGVNVLGFFSKNTCDFLNTLILFLWNTKDWNILS
jgi:hypothetical protein